MIKVICDFCGEKAEGQLTLREEKDGMESLLSKLDICVDCYNKAYNYLRDMSKITKLEKSQKGK